MSHLLARTKNLLDNQARSREYRGVVYTVNADKSIKMYGTATSQVSFLVLMGDGVATNTITAYSTPIFKKGDSVILSTGSNELIQWRHTDGTYASSSQIAVDTPLTFSKDVGLIYVQVNPNVHVDKTIYPMIRRSDISDNTYEPYRIEKPLDHVYVKARTENLFDWSAATTGYRIQWLTGEPFADANAIMSDFIPVSAGIYRANASFNLVGYDENKTYVGTYDPNTRTFRKEYGSKTTFYGISDSNVAYVKLLSFANTDTLSESTMFNAGSTPLPYEPYLITKEAWEARTRVILHNLTNPLCGIRTYKDTLDLSTGTLTRYIKKLVLDGTEETFKADTGGMHRYLVRTPISYADKYIGLCTHYQYKFGTPSAYGYFHILTDGTGLAFFDDRDISANAFKQWLADQYTAGNPITVWYVLATPTTETITVPSNLTGIVEGYLTQSSTPSPTSPVYPTANGTLEQGGTYSLDTGAYAIAWGRADTFTGTNPMSARCYGLPIKSWEIDGNTQQDGTPTPDNQITPEFVGETTGNLFDAKRFVDTAIPSNGTVSLSGNTIILSPIEQDAYVNRVYSRTQSVSPDERKCCIPVSPETEYTIIMENARKSYVSFIGSDYSCVYGYSQIPKTTPQEPFTFTTPSDCTYIVIRLGQWVASTSTQIEFPNIMLVKGSEVPSAYEPYGYAIQTYSYTQNTVSGQTPLTLTDSVGHNLISWDGEGATTSSGTPAPTSPVTVSGWGNKTENLFDGIIGVDNKILTETGGSGTNNLYALSKYIPVEPNTSYVYHFYHNIAENRSTYSISEYDSNKNVILPITLNWITENRDYNMSFTTQANTAYIRINWKKPYDEYLTLNLGSTPLTYEPYGYKIPITSAGQTQTVYLGQVQTTRRVKKYVVTGKEDWTVEGDGTYYALPITPNLIDRNDLLSTHFFAGNYSGALEIGQLRGAGTPSAKIVFNYDNGAIGIEGFKSWLATQYAAGTPVTVWYVLAEPTTGIVNEPLMKIGNYADSIISTQSRVTIPTAKGNATLTTNNTVQPSIIHATYDKYISGGDVPVYLGQVPTTRRIKKLTFTGMEDWQVSAAWKKSNTSVFFYDKYDMENTVNKTEIYVLSDKFSATSRDGLYNGDSNMIAKTGSYAMTIRVSDSIATTASAFKSWLTLNPVTVWYVLATPTTGIVNEPLAKIGKYTDTLTSEQAGVTIPTTDGNNIISVDTTLAPSKMTITGHIRDVWFKQSITGVSPLSFKSNGTPLISLSMKGSGQQTGTPTPDNIIMPTFCGKRTENLAPPLTEWVDGYIADNGTIQPPGPTTQQKSSGYISITAGETYTFSIENGFLNGENGPWRAIGWYTQDKTFISREPDNVSDALSTSAPLNAAYCRLSYRTYGEKTNPVFNVGSIPLHYEPYGYKLPITCAGQTVPVYLGQVQTTRKVKKLVLDGTETWYKSNTEIADRAYFATQITSDSVVEGKGLCTHFVNTTVYTVTTDSGFRFVSNGGLRIRTPDVATLSLDAFKQWLAAQYAAGTPVTVWHVLATPTTGIVNEPLCKIGDYADELYSTDTEVSIPTTNSENTLTVDTDLQPSEMTITGYIKAIDQ